MPTAEGSEPRSRRAQKSPGAFRTISEVARELTVQQHVLRFWETKFAQIRPVKRSGGRRYYRPEDVALLRDIRRLLYDEGYTIRGVQRLLRKGGARGRAQGDATPDVVTVDRRLLEDLVRDLRETRELLRRAAG